MDRSFLSTFSKYSKYRGFTNIYLDDTKRTIVLVISQVCFLIITGIINEKLSQTFLILGLRQLRGKLIELRFFYILRLRGMSYFPLNFYLIFFCSNNCLSKKK